MKFVTFVMLGALATCPAEAGPQPTASEIFQLRTECMKLGKEMLKEYQDADISSSFFSKYDETTNRCYVLIKLHFRKEDTDSLQLLDGQGAGMIAAWSKNLGLIKGNTVSPPIAFDFIQNMMNSN